ncbi:hypothetical protein Tco_0474623 [Tanacetum coccineum]
MKTNTPYPEEHIRPILLIVCPVFQSEEEVTEAMTEPTMEEYMMKTREDYGSGIARPKFNEKIHFELKGQFLKEIHIQEVILFYKGLDVPTRHSKGAIPSMKAADAKKAIQDMADHS